MARKSLPPLPHRNNCGCSKVMHSSQLLALRHQSGVAAGAAAGHAVRQKSRQPRGIFRIQTRARSSGGTQLPVPIGT
jgi:hypothetical protein